MHFAAVFADAHEVGFLFVVLAGEAGDVAVFGHGCITSFCFGAGL